MKELPLITDMGYFLTEIPTMLIWEFQSTIQKETIITKWNAVVFLLTLL